VIISNELGLDHVAEEADIPTRVLSRRSLSVQWFSVIEQATVGSVILCYCAGHCHLSDSGIA